MYSSLSGCCESLFFRARTGNVLNTIFVEWTDTAAQFHSVEITPERAQGLRGPYNRRNVYGAVLAYGPIVETDTESASRIETRSPRMTLRRIVEPNTFEPVEIRLAERLRLRIAEARQLEARRRSWDWAARE